MSKSTGIESERTLNKFVIVALALWNLNKVSNNSCISLVRSVSINVTPSLAKTISF